MVVNLVNVPDVCDRQEAEVKVVINLVYVPGVCDRQEALKEKTATQLRLWELPQYPVSFQRGTKG